MVAMGKAVRRLTRKHCIRQLIEPVANLPGKSEVSSLQTNIKAPLSNAARARNLLNNCKA